MSGETVTSDEALAWQTIRPVTESRTAVELTPGNAHVIAERFGGTVEVVDGFMGAKITRLYLGNTSGPARGWITENGNWLPEHLWEADEEKW